MTHPQNVAINADYLALVRRYAELAGMSVKAAVEYAIDRTLVPELNDYDRYEDDPKVEAITKAANALLPEDWGFDVCSYLTMDNPDDPNEAETLIRFYFWSDDDGMVTPTFLTIDEAQGFRNSLADLPQSGGQFVVGGKHSGDPFKVRRAGRGIRLELLDRTTGKPTEKISTIAATSVPRICGALDSIIEAARIEEARP